MASDASPIVCETVNGGTDPKQHLDSKQHLAAAGGPEAPSDFDYRWPAELFPTRSRKPRRNPVTYKRFSSAAAAIRYAIEELPSDLLLGAYLQVEEERFGSDGIRKLYDSGRYPLKRRAASRP